MPNLGNHVDAIFLPESVNTSTKLKINDADGSIVLGDIATGTSTTDSGIIFDHGTGSTVKGGLFTEVDGEILSYGINVSQVDTGYDTSKVGGIFRLDTRNGGSSYFNGECFIIKGRPKGTAKTEYNAFGIALDDGNTILVPHKGNVGIGIRDTSAKLHIAGGNSIRLGDNEISNVNSSTLYGSNKVTNGDFSNADLTGWTLGNTNNSFSPTNQLVIVNYSGGQGPYQSFTTTTGQIYEVSILTNGTGAFATIIDGSGLTGDELLVLQGGSSESTVTGTFTTISTTTTVSLTVPASGASGLFDDILVRAVTGSDGDGITITNAVSSDALAAFNTDGSAELYYDNSKKFETSSTGVTVTGNLVSDGISLGDSEKVNFGAGDDLQIYHDGSNSYIDDTGTGQLYIRGSAAIHLENSAGTKKYARFVNSAAAELYYDNSKKIETTSTGVSVTGTALATALSTGAAGTGINISTDTITGPATLTIDPAAIGDDTGLVIIKGDFQVDGTTTTINSTTLTVDDKNIVLASGAANSAAADGAGITIDGANATILYKSTPDAWSFNKDVGIGTDSPSEKLTIGSTATSDNYLRINSANNTDSGIKFYSDLSATKGYLTGYRGNSNLFFIQSDNAGTITDRFVIDESGNVGINATSPSHKLHVVGDVRAQGGALILNYADADNIDHLWHDDTSEYGTPGSFVFNSDTTYKNSTGGTWSNIKVGHVYVNNGNLGTTVGNIQDLARFYANNGNATSIRIQAKRKVAGNNWQSAGYKIFCHTDATEQGYIEFNPHTTTANDGSYDVAIGSGSDEIIRFKDGGNVGIGTTNPGAKLEVNGDAKINGLTVGRGGNDVSSNTAVGNNALNSNTTGQFTTGSSNTAVGSAALYNNTIGSKNSATGLNSLYSNTLGDNNVANGYEALYSNTTAPNNTGIGYQALYTNTTGEANVANGYRALYLNTTGDSNTANGVQALRNNTTGHSNTAVGDAALFWNTTGDNNVACGFNALFYNTTANFNIGIGESALYNTTTGNANIGIGRDAAKANTTGAKNSVVGDLALLSNETGDYNVAIGEQSGRFIEGANNTILGAYKGTSADSSLNDTVIIAAGRTERVRIDSLGNFGIGTSTPSERLEVDGVILSSGPIVDTVWYKETWPAYNETTATLAGNDLGTWTLTGGTLATGTATYAEVDTANLPSGLKAVRWNGASAVSYLTSPAVDLSDFRTNEKITTINQTGSLADRSVSDSRIYLTVLLAAQSMDSNAEHMEVQLSNDNGVTFHEHQAFVWQDNDADSDDITDTTWRKVVIDISEFVYKPSSAVLDGFKIRFMGTGTGTGDGYGVSNIYIHDAPIPNKLKAKTLKLGDASLSNSDDLDYDEYLEIVSSVNTFKGLVLNAGPDPRDNYVGVNGADSLVLAADELNAGNNSRIDFRIDGKDRMKLYTSTDAGASVAHLQLIGHTTPTDRSNWRISAHDDSTTGYFAISDYSGGSWNENFTVNESGHVTVNNNLYIGGTIRYLSSPPTGDYGSIQINGTGGLGYEGYSIDGRAVFMHDGSTTMGLFDDVNNHWVIHHSMQANDSITSIRSGNGADTIVCTGSNNVGIGIANPSAKLDVVGSIKASSQLISSVVTGTAPLSVASTTLVSNLNADKLDGLHATSFLRSDATTTFDCSGNDFQFDYDTARTLMRITQLGTEKLRLSASGNTITLDPYNSGTLAITANVSFSSATTPITTNSIKFNNTEMSSTYYTNASGVLAFDENFSGDTTEYGTDAYAPAQVYSDNGGGLVIKNEDGWGAVFTSQNARWATPTFEGIGVGQTASGCRNVLDLGSGTQNRGISWGGTNANYCNIWAEYSSGDLILGSGVRPTGTSTGFVSSYGGSSLGRSAIELQMSNGNINFFNATASTVADGGSVSTSLSMVIEGGGNVGIGTNSPSSKLHVVGDITTTSGNLYLNDGTMSIGDNGGYEGVYWESENHAITYNDGTGNFNIRVGNNGLTDEKCTEAGFTFQDEWSQSSGWRQFNISSASLAVGATPTWRTQIEYDPNAAYLRYQGTTKLYTTASGVTVNGAVNPTSDIRLKENIQDIESPLDKVNSLRGVKFDWKSNGETDYGFIAQEVEQVIPEIVRTETLTENINKVHEETEVKTLSYQAIIGVLVEAVKELTSEVEALKSQISGS